jgi:hypothetical protein
VKNKIRERISYEFWLNIIKSIACPVRAEYTCEEIHRQMDNRMLFGTTQQSEWDKESMELALEDYKSKWVKFQKV